MAAKKNEQHPLRIEGYGSAGEGVARLEGQAVFVKGALAGEICQVQLLKVGKSAAWGRVTQVLTPVPGRQSPDCPRYPRCGGCQLRHMTYAEELRFKRQKVQDALQRIGGWTGRVEKIHGAEAPDRYRNKIQFPVADGPRVGFFRARSHEVIDAEDCLLQPLAATRLREAFKLWMERYQVPAYDERVHGGLIRHFYVRVNQRGQSLCAVIANGTDLPHQEELVQALRRAEPDLAGVVLSVNQEKTNVILGKTHRCLWGRDYLEDTLCGLTFRLSVPSFYQVNREQAEVLYGRALAFAGLTGRETVLDLYCGIGTITLVMARQAGRAIGAEVIPAAVEDAVKAWDYLMYQGYGARDVVVAGDSAGGNLALVLTHLLKEAGRRLPRALILLSPWTDMTASGKSYQERAAIDPVLTVNYIHAVRDAYARDQDWSDFRLSPLFGDLKDFPPTLIQAGSSELLLSDSIRLRDRLVQAAVPCRLEVWTDLWHVFQMFPMKKATEAMESIGRFLLETL